SVSQRVPTGGSGPARRPCSPGAAAWRATRPRPRSSGQLLGHVRHVGLAPAVQQRGHGEAHGHLHGHRRQHHQQQHLPGGVRGQEPPESGGGQQNPVDHQLQAHHHHHHHLLGQRSVETYREQRGGHHQHGFQGHRPTPPGWGSSAGRRRRSSPNRS